MSSTPAPAPAPTIAPDPSHILLAAAVAFELRPFARRLGLQPPKRGIAHGVHRERHVSLLATGLGRPADATFASALRDLQPDAVINIGIAGALDPGYPAGSAWVVHEWRRPVPPHDLVAHADPELVTRLRRTLDEAGVAWQPAGAVMVDAPLHDAAARDRIHHGSGAQLVEMEGAAWAAIAATRGIPFAAVRVVSDHANRSLPGKNTKDGRRAWLLRDDGKPRRRRLAWALLASGAWLRPRRALSRVEAAGRQFREAGAGLERVAAAMLPADGCATPGDNPR